MWEYAGIVRNIQNIKKFALPEIKKIEKELSQISTINPEIAEAKNMATVSKIILEAIIKRKKSLGCHFLED